MKDELVSAKVDKLLKMAVTLDCSQQLYGVCEKFPDNLAPTLPAGTSSVPSITRNSMLLESVYDERAVPVAEKVAMKVKGIAAMKVAMDALLECHGAFLAAERSL